MGFGRWWITHGPGSPGSVAKAMAMSYNRLRGAYPSASNVHLLFSTLRTRYPLMDDTTITQMVDECKGSLIELTLIVIHREIPAATGAMCNAPSVYSEMLDVVNEVTQRYAPGA